MTNNKQTAVEWLIEQLHRKYGGTDFFWTNMDEIEQAKEMEKEQMKIAFEIYRDLLSHYEDGSAFEDYYKQTYGGNNEQQ